MYILVVWIVVDVLYRVVFDFLLVRIIIMLSVFVGFEFIIFWVLFRVLVIFVLFLFLNGVLVMVDFIVVWLLCVLKLNCVEMVKLKVINVILVLFWLIVK